ncbi:MAG: DUF2306 domain-containing protein [Bosea sp. (in: a-proteobacteria)]
MTLAPLFAAPVVVQMHIAAALLALLFALAQFAGLGAGGVKGLIHRLIGWGFVLAMTVTAISSFWIIGLNHGRFSWIHLLSILALVSLPIAIIARRQGNIRRHKWAMIGLTAGLVIAGAFTLLPTRIMHLIIFGG